jgi:hypothetical protein
MLIARPEGELFYKLHRALMFFVNQRLHVLADHLASPTDFGRLPPEPRIRVRNAFLEHTDLLQTFVVENPDHLSDEELDIARSWRHLVAGKFLLFRKLKNYTVFLSTSQPPIAYGVLALAQQFEELVGPDLPVLTETVLLPFKDKIIYDGLLNAFRISFGPGIRRSLNETFKEAKARHGIVTSLPLSDEPMPAPAPKTRPRPKAPAKKMETAEVLQVITEQIDQFCRENLNDEFAVICRKLAEKLARKRPSPLLRGSPNAWASGIVRNIGWVNFLDDKAQTPHLRLGDIDAHFGISSSTGATKLAAIRKMFKLHRFDPNWTLPSRLQDNPMVWMLGVNELMMDIRDAPREAQEVAFQKGLIPYIPADREKGQE